MLELNKKTLELLDIYGYSDRDYWLYEYSLTKRGDFVGELLEEYGGQNNE